MPSACRHAGRGRTASSREQPYRLATACRDHAIPFDAGAANAGGSAPIRLENTTDSLFNRNTDGVIGSENSEPNTASQHAASDVLATVVNPPFAGESTGEHAAPISSPAPAPDARAYVAEPAPQQKVSTKECAGKQPGRATNLLLVATLAAVCGLAGGLAGGAIMSAATGGSTQAAQGGMGRRQGGMQGSGAPSADGVTNSSGDGASDGNAPSGQAPTGAPGASEALSSGSQGGMWGETGLFRLWTSDFGDQITWLAPIAFAAIILGLIAAAPAKKGQVYFGRFYLGKYEHEVDLNTVARIRRAQIVIFGAWLVVTWLVFSFMAGIFHAYYTVALSPAIAVLVAICGASLLELCDRPWMPGVAGLLVAMTSAWDMALILRSGSFAWLGVCIGAVGVAAGLALCIIGFWIQDRLPATWPLALKHGARGIAAIGIVALLTGPIVWTACTFSTGHTGSIVTAGPGGSMGGGPGGGGPSGNGAPDDTGGTAADDSSSESVSGDGSAATPDGGSGLLGGTSANDSLVELLTQNASGYR